MPISSHPNRIHLSDLEIQMHIGVGDAEFAKPQRVLVCLDVAIDPPLIESDAIDLTLDYNILRDGIKTLAMAKGFRTLEAFGAAIMALLQEQPLIIAAQVLVKKPDIFEDCEFVGFSHFWER